MDEKYCPTCGRNRSRGDFHRNKSKGDGLDSYCKECRKGITIATEKRIREDNRALRLALAAREAEVARLRESWRGMQGALYEAECEVAELRAALVAPPPGDGAGE